MARGRFIDKAICIDKTVNDLSSSDSMLGFTWLITHLDCEGRTHGDPAVVRSFVFPRRKDITVEQMESFIQEWHDAGLIIWYEVDGDKYIYFPKFNKYQVGLNINREAKSMIPAPELVMSESGVSHEQNPIKLIKELSKVKADRVPLFEPLFVHFAEYSEIPIPNNKNSGEFMTGWFEPAEKILDMTELDVGRAKDLITKAIDKATGKFTISSPRSLIKTIAGIMAEEKRLQKQSIGKEFKAAEFLAEQKQ